MFDLIIVWVGIILKIIYALMLSVVIYSLQWIIYPLRLLTAQCLGNDFPHAPVYPPKCSQIL